MDEVLVKVEIEKVGRGVSIWKASVYKNHDFNIYLKIFCISDYIF